MHARKLLAGLATTAVAVSTIALSAGPASAVYTAGPLDPTFTPVAADLIGGGSDTTMGSIHYAAQLYNAQSPAPAAKVASYAAAPQPAGGTIPLPGAPEINRPNGSGGGKTLLYGSNNNSAIDFARSSSSLNTNEVGAQLYQFPFALDTLQMAVSNSTPSNAPASLTPKQIVDIYSGAVTNWSQVGGKPGVIAPKIPQSGSGTGDFFRAQLKTMNGGIDVSLAGTVGTVQEHDDTDIKSNANAVGPFSLGRAELLGGTVRLTDPAGWKADRAVYNVVRLANLNDAAVQAFFGPSGFLCSDAAKGAIKQGGLTQLASQAKGGVCGVSTQEATSNFLTSDPVATTTALTISSDAARTATLTAAVKGSTAPRGTVTFYDGATTIAANVPLVSGQAKTTVANLTPGVRSYKAVYTPVANSYFVTSENTASGTVKTSSTIKASFPKKAKAGKKVKGKVTVTLADVAAQATGKVTVKAGSKTVGTGTLKAGKATLVLKKLKAGVNKLKVVWTGDSSAVGSTSKTIKVKVAKAKK